MLGNYGKQLNGKVKTLDGICIYHGFMVAMPYMLLHARETGLHTPAHFAHKMDTKIPNKGKKIGLAWQATILNVINYIGKERVKIE